MGYHRGLLLVLKICLYELKPLVVTNKRYFQQMSLFFGPSWHNLKDTAL